MFRRSVEIFVHILLEKYIKNFLVLDGGQISSTVFLIFLMSEDDRSRRLDPPLTMARINMYIRDKVMPISQHGIVDILFEI